MFTKQSALDFAAVDFIGHRFADQIFRIFARDYPDLKLVTETVNKDVRTMIGMAQNTLDRERVNG